jgi:hypothetical protein
MGYRRVRETNWERVVQNIVGEAFVAGTIRNLDDFDFCERAKTRPTYPKLDCSGCENEDMVCCFHMWELVYVDKELNSEFVCTKFRKFLTEVDQ